ncbi:MAG TPA: YbaK/EbsC family protein [Bryobacteraceae bacterium]|nr:YbaK/EbsC family protein [Bryobacteraceae bacterium]HOL71332.1 YbaK/EbsC family protein [Bryobacteraceae bacterium]HOQ47451.1 YbaK/EbsC family protein [Bryobacteraceae bacterium]HPQ17152.1 YbaK/EbsC family protein [Bryobacteraceae bacterium]HPU74040.1 YbaK/EbsC family protein [Bryobacteraceae bacterium]
MPVLANLREFLDQNGVEYTHTIHPLAYTAREVAMAECVPAREVAKTVIFLSEQGYGMAVLPGDCVVDLEQLRLDLGLSRLRLATEAELKDLFPTCELGAMPPFGNLFGLPVYVDSRLAGEDMITFNAGTHRDVIHMHFADFERLVHPSIVPFARRTTMAV